MLDEAVEAGARYFKACEVIKLSIRTIQRYRQHGEVAPDGRKAAAVSRVPGNKLSEQERIEVLITANLPVFASLPPSQIVPALADEGRYIASESSFYRILRENKQLVHRGKAKGPSHSRPQSLEATAPNQLWSWDITYLATTVLAIPYPARRCDTATVTKTGFVEVDGNRYSVPSRYCGQCVTVAFYPEKIEVIVNSHPVATHRRCCDKRQTIEHPTHRTDLFKLTPAYKEKRIYLLMTKMDADIDHFIRNAEHDGHDPVKAARMLYNLLRQFKKPCLLSAIREALAQKVTRPDLVAAILAKPLSSPACPVTPRNGELLTLAYEERSLACYDPT